MKDKNGIKICCKNCNDDVAINCLHYNPDNPDEDWGCVVSGGFVPSYDALFARIAELQAENERLSKELIDLGTGTLAEKNYQSAMRAGAALCVAAKKLNYDTSNLSIYDLIEVFLKEGNDVLNRLRKKESEEK